MGKMKWVAACAALLVVAGCNAKKKDGTVQNAGEEVSSVAPPPKRNHPKPPTGALLAQKYATCVGMVNAGRSDEFIAECIDDLYISHDVPQGSDRKGNGAVIEWFRVMRAAFHDWQVEPQLVLVTGRNILAIDLSTGTHTGPMPTPIRTIQPTNKRLGMFMFHRLAINDANKASEEWSYMDYGTLFDQLGPMPQGQRRRPASDKGFGGAPIFVVATHDAVERANLDVVRKQIEAVNARNFGDAVALLAPEIVITDFGIKDDVVGIRAVEKAWKTFIDGFPDGKDVIENIWAAGDYVVVTGTYVGTHQNDIGALKKTGKTVALDFAEVFKVHDGQITNMWRFASGMQMASQLGLYSPRPPSTDTRTVGAPAPR